MSKMKNKQDLSLLRFDGANGPVHFVVSNEYGDEGESDESLQSNKEYLYESHSCPTNWLRNVVAVIDETGDEDPHGFLKHVRTVRVAKDFDPSDIDPEHCSWTTLFPEAASGYIPPNAPHEPVDAQFEPADMTDEERAEAQRLRDTVEQRAAGLDATVVARAFEVMLPAHKAELRLIHNEHKVYYKTVKETLEEDDPQNPYYDFVTEVERQKAIETDELWVLHWYPETPVGFNIICAASLPALGAWLQNHGLAFGS